MNRRVSIRVLGDHPGEFAAIHRSSSSPNVAAVACGAPAATTKAASSRSACLLPTPWTVFVA
jgi:hypothetical protein